MLNIQQPIRTAAALALFVSGFAFAAPAFAASAQEYDQTNGQDNAPAPQKPVAGTTKKHTAANHEMSVEQRIQNLHDKLQIAQDEEADWAKVAGTMRDNEAQIHDLIRQRHQNADNMSAVDDLKSYQQITQAHADGIQKLTASFAPLYDEMSDAQKANADTVFGRFEGHRDGAMKKHK